MGLNILQYAIFVGVKGQLMEELQKKHGKSGIKEAMKIIRCPYCKSASVKAVKYKDISKLPYYYRQAICMKCGYSGFIPPETYEKLLKWNGEDDKYSS